MDAECVADFVDGSLSVSYGDEIAENTDEIVDEYVEISEEDTKKISAIVLPLIKKAIHANIEAIPDEL